MKGRQKSALARNFTKYRLVGMVKSLTNLSSSESVTKIEAVLLTEAKSIISVVLDSWDINSKTLGFTPLKERKHCEKKIRKNAK